jgi:hypothetical protein
MIETHFPQLPGLLNQSHTDSVIVKEFRKALRYISRASDNSLLLTELKDIQSLMEEKREDLTLQGVLTEGVMKAKIKAFKISLEANTHRLAFYISISDSNAGRWLDVCPKSEKFTFSNDEFRSQLCYRMFLKQPCHIAGSKCSCKSRPVLDELGHHLATACGKGGYRNATHTALEYTCKDLLNCAGIMTRREEVGCFRGSNEDNNQRPDLSIYNMPQKDKKVVADIMVTCPVPVRFTTALSVNQAKKAGRAAEQAHRYKNNKYTGIANDNDLEFQALIFESTGRLHPECENFLKLAIAKMADGNNKLSSVFTHFWMRRISCALQKCISSAILNRSNLINGNLVHETNYEFSSGFMIDHDHIN